MNSNNYTFDENDESWIIYKSNYFIFMPVFKSSPFRDFFLFQFLSNFGYLDKIEKIPREIVNPNVQKDILWLEKQEGSMNFKFGVIFAKAGQIMDDELFSNETGR